MRIACATCGFSAALPGVDEQRCPNCGSLLAPATPSASPDEIRAWVDAHTHVAAAGGYPGLLVEIVRRPPLPGGYRDSAEVHESIRIRKRLGDWVASAVQLMTPAYVAAGGLILVGMGHWAVAALAAGSVIVAATLGARELALRRAALLVDAAGVVAHGRHIAPSVVHAVRQVEGARGFRVVLALDDGSTVRALERLSAHQAEYVADLLRDVLRQASSSR